MAIILTLISGILAGLFGGMWWQARKTAEVWEKAYTHVREQLTFIKHDTYNTGQPEPEPRPRATGGVVGKPDYGLVGEKPSSYPAPPMPSAAAMSVAEKTFVGLSDKRTDHLARALDLDDDPIAVQVRK